MKPQIDTLLKVSIREAWPSEPAHFTPWLSEENNIDQIGNLIGRELEVISSEHSVGSYKADILCQDLSNDEKVIVENQYGKTDHTHLGQILTYAAGVGASTIIWLSEIFSEEHRAALDWLNENTGDNIEFYGIEIELYRIGNSLPAPLFNIVAKPNNWSKSVRKSAESSDYSETKILQQAFWTALKEYIESSKGKYRWKMQKPLPQHWTNIAIGRSSFHISMFVNIRDGRVGAHLVISNPSCAEKFNRLQSLYMEDSQKYFNNELEWEFKEGGKEHHVSLRKRNVNPENKSEWPDLHRWLAESVDKFFVYFQDKIRTLDYESVI